MQTTQQSLYTREQVIEAYYEWSKLPPCENALSSGGTDMDRFVARQLAWDKYVDRRDGLPEGTTTAKRLRREKGSEVQ